MHQRSWKFPSQNAQIFGYVYRSTNGQNHGPVWKTQWSLSKGICTVTLWQDCLLWERQFEKVILKHGWEKVSNWECFFVNRARGLFLSVYVDDIEAAGKTENIGPMWKVLMKDVDLGEPTSFLDHVYLGCTQRECQISKNIEDNYRSMFESRIPVGVKEKRPSRNSGKLDAETTSSWSYDMEGHEKKCVENIANLRIKQLNNYTKSQRHAWMTINLKKKKSSQ